MKKTLFILFLLPVYCYAQIIQTVVGNGIHGYSGDGGPATNAQINIAIGVAVDTGGNIFVPDYNNNVVRKVNTTGVIQTIAGTGTIGYSGDGGPALAATLNHPWNVAVDKSGNLYIVEQGNNVIRKVNSAGIITTYAGTGVYGYGGDGGPATAATFHIPWDIVFDTSGAAYIDDGGNNVIRKVSLTGIVSTFAGTGVGGYNGDGLTALSAQMNNPIGLAFDRNGNLYVGDNLNNRIRMIDPSGIIHTVAGTGLASYSGDGGSAVSATMNAPMAVRTDTFGNVYIADFGNNVIREITGTVIRTIAGNGVYAYGGDGGDPLLASLAQPWGLSVDNRAYVFIADKDNDRIREVIPCGAAIAGSSHVCTGNTITLSNSVAGGTWSSLPASVAIVGINTGIVTGVSPGTSVVTYSTPSGCVSTTTITVSQSPSAIAGDTAVCVGSLIILSNAIGGGTWSSGAAGIGTVGSVTATVTGIAPGTTIITYEIPGGCVATKSITVSAVPLPISGGGNVCMGYTLNLSDAVSGGMWSAANTVIAVVGLTSGVVTGNAAGSTIITYSMPGLCFVTTTVTVNAAPSMITGNTIICAGSQTSLHDSTGGGVWSSGSPGIATIDPTLGVVTGNVPGSAVITYSLPGACPATATVTVTPMPSAIAGGTIACTGLQIMLSDAVSGGTWTSGSPGIATISPVNGGLWGVAPGTAVITYSIGNCAVTNTVIVNTTPVVLLANDTFCNGEQLVIGSPEPPGVSYYWSTSSTDSSIIVSTAGSYSLTVTSNGCSETGTADITRLSPPSPIDLGPDTTLCEGEEITLHSGEVSSIWNNYHYGQNFTVNKDGTYWVVAGNKCGFVSDTINVAFTVCDITIPNAFTPNDDGLNDILRAIGSLSFYTGYSLSIYNRWGQRIFFTQDIYEGWDGKFNGIPQDVGVYFYMMTYTLHGKSSTLKGDITLIR